MNPETKPEPAFSPLRRPIRSIQQSLSAKYGFDQITLDLLAQFTGFASVAVLRTHLTSSRSFSSDARLARHRRRLAILSAMLLGVETPPRGVAWADPEAEAKLFLAHWRVEGLTLERIVVAKTYKKWADWTPAAEQRRVELEDVRLSLDSDERLAPWLQRAVFSNPAESPQLPLVSPPEAPASASPHNVPFYAEQVLAAHVETNDLLRQLVRISEETMALLAEANQDNPPGINPASNDGRPRQ